MLLKNTSTRFGHVSVLIHWLVALAVYGMFALGLWMVTLSYYDKLINEIICTFVIVGNTIH